MLKNNDKPLKLNIMSNYLLNEYSSNKSSVMMNFKKILIAVDNSICSEIAAKTGYEMAHQFGAEVALVNIIEPIPASINPDFTMTPVFLEIFDQNEENSHLLLQEMEKKYSLGISTTHLAVLDTASHGILQQAEQWKADLIVLGTHGRTGVYHFLLGSVAEYVARKSSCPVLIIPNNL